MRLFAMSLMALALTACDTDTAHSPLPEEGAIYDGDGDGVLSDVDCDDHSARIHPGTVELCDSIDNDCDGQIDEDPIDGEQWFLDYDGDSYGNPNFAEKFCSAPRGGYARNADDCNDLEIRSYPGHREECDGIDNNCDGNVDEDAVDLQRFYLDLDADGYGTDEDVVVACFPPEDYVTIAGDCDDTDARLNPETRWFPDIDGDGFGQPFFSAASCEPLLSHVKTDTDCDDEDPAVFPGAAYREHPSLCTIDQDGDGFGSATPKAGIDPGMDCDDEDPTTNRC